MIKTRSIIDKFEQSSTKVNLPVRVKSPTIPLRKKSTKSRESTITNTYKVYTSGYHERKRIKDQCSKVVSMAHLLFLSCQSNQININAFEAWNPQNIPPKAINYITGSTNQHTQFKNYIANNYELKIVVDSINKYEVNDSENKNKDANSYNRNSNSMIHCNKSENLNNQQKNKMHISQDNYQIDGQQQLITHNSKSNNYNNRNMSPINFKIHTPKGKKYNNNYQNIIEDAPVSLTRMQKEKLALKISKENAKLSKSPQPQLNNTHDNYSNNNTPIKNKTKPKEKPVIQVFIVKSSKKQDKNYHTPQSKLKRNQKQIDKQTEAKNIIVNSNNQNKNKHNHLSPKSIAQEQKLAKLKMQLSQLKNIKNNSSKPKNNKYNNSISDSDGSIKDSNKKENRNYYNYKTEENDLNDKSYKYLNNYLD